MTRRTRILAKTASWQIMGLGIMAIVGYAHTGSWTTGGGIALSGAALGFVSYGAHEWLWDRMDRPRSDQP